ncbi:4876_t:CDS:2 [Racocetra persica]|uniref:4876_t:CDS:1 n=1 Tax=Racocetra persica TaxID=160502 RepID=A0ACA9K816_9GLOM|nr:4876_t:CDS:2 [Racocetra persica]
MNELHYSDKSACSLQNNSIIYQIGACEHNKLKDDYIELDDFLFEKQIYEHANIQQFLLIDVIKRYRFIKDLQLTFPIGVYREFCIKYHQWTCLISANDKHKVPIGEDIAVSTGVRNRHSIVGQESILAAADHNFSKLSLTPSHDSMSLESETLFGMANTLNDICKKAQESVKLKSKLKESIRGVQEILNNRTERLKLKDSKFRYVYGTITTEEHRPIYMQSQAKSESISKSIRIAEKIRDYIDCKDCQKCCYVYSNKSLTDDKLYDF